MNEAIKKINSFCDSIYDKIQIKNKVVKKIISILIFSISIHLLFSYIGVYKFIDKRPCSIHSSAQCQRASVALNYYKNDMNFFEPRIQRYYTGSGITGLEFPIIYYSAAIMYKLFGFNEIFLRLINLSFVLFGLFLFYKLSYTYLKSYILTLFIIGSAVISPVLLFYSPNFLPDAPSFGLVMASWYYFFRFMNTNKNKYLNLFVMCGTLAALIKSIAILCFLVVFSLLILDALKFFKTTEKIYLFKNKKRILLTIIIGFLMVFIWYFYAHYITIKYNNQTFALSPIMVDSWASLMKVWEFMKNYWAFQYYAYETYILLLLAIIIVIICIKHVNRLLISITTLYILGSICYFYFFTNQFQNHDYYIIAILPCAFFCLLTFGDIIIKLSKKYFRPIIVILVIALFFNIKEALINCKKNYYNRYLYELEYLQGIDYRSYEELEPILRSKGIKRTDKTISAFDETYCSSLYLMDQIGINIDQATSIGGLEPLLQLPEIKYLVVNDSAKFNQLYHRDYRDKIIITYRGLIVYKLK